MSYKVNADGTFAEFRGWTIICPVKEPNLPIGVEVDEINRSWSKILGDALKLITDSSNSASWALLPHASLHMTVLGLGEEKSGRVPRDMKVRFPPHFLGLLTNL